jgi:hypothetical protein
MYPELMEQKEIIRTLKPKRWSKIDGFLPSDSHAFLWLTLNKRGKRGFPILLKS